ncbi:MAG: alpha/beta hydrolase family protein, partial [Polyangiales bacterium]
AIIKCARDKVMAASDFQTILDTNGYVGKPLTSGAFVYRVLYRTERGDTANSPGYSSAIAYVPIVPRNAQLPAVVASHGSRGQAAHCAPSLDDPAASYVEPDFQDQVYPLIGSGYAVLAPDLAGYSNYGAAGNPPSGYAAAADVGKSTLDGARALRNMIPSMLSSKTVITGHSQGGHTALSALAMSNDYGADQNVSAVMLYAPLWLNEAAWGAAVFEATTFPLSGTSNFVDAVSLWYHYSHAELLQGAGHGLDIIQPAKQAVVKSFFDNDCWQANYPDLGDAGNTLKDFYTSDFASAIALPAALGTACAAVDAGVPDGSTDGGAADAGPSLCQRWTAIYATDRPHITGAAAAVPILILYGGQDTTIPAPQEMCAIDRLHTDGTQLTVCVDPTKDHSKVLHGLSSYANDWIASKVLGEAAPTACASSETALVNDAGVQIKCGTPPPND